MPKIINDNCYYNLTEIAQISGVNVRSLRRWFDNGDLTHFITMYQMPNGIIGYRLGSPHPSDVLVDGKPYCYVFPTPHMKGDSV